MEEDLRGPAAAFVARALAMPVEPEQLADDLTFVADDGVVAAFAVELESSAGDVAFLIYVYRLTSRDAAGDSGRERMERDLATMTDAERLDAPGPRPVAQAEDGALGFLLTTTPAILRALGGEEPSMAAESPPMERGDAATALLESLRAAEAASRTWLDSVPAGAPRTPEEAELALHLLEPGNLEPLLTAIQRLTTVDAGERSGERAR